MRDPVTGLLLARHRWYDASVGRWITRDPAGYVDGLSLYLYARGNPFALVDPMGLGASRSRDDDDDRGGILSGIGDLLKFVTGGSASNGGDEGGAPRHVENAAAIGRLSESVNTHVVEPANEALQTANAMASVLPGWGEVQDIYTMVAPGKSMTDRALAGTSISINLATGGFAPDYSSVKGVAVAGTHLLGEEAAQAVKQAAIRAADGVLSGTDDAVSGIRKATSNLRGGAYGELPVLEGVARHHMPADSVSPLSRSKGPAVHVELGDHMQTSSWGSSNAAKLYRADIKSMLGRGDFRGAVAADIRDLRRVAGSKYNRPIKEMLDYAREQGFLD